MNSINHTADGGAFAGRQSRMKSDPGLLPGATIASSLPLWILSASLLITALTVAWTCLGFLDSRVGSDEASRNTGLVLLALCSGFWVVTAFAMVRHHRTAAKTGELARDREHLLQEHELLRAIIDNLPDYIYAKDVPGRFVLNNVAHAKALGVESPEALIGKSDFDFFPRDLAEQYRANEERILQSGEPLLNHEQIRCDKAGNSRWVSASKVIWRDKDGTVLGIAGISRDIHDAKVAREKLHQFSLQLERSNRELQDFAYVASHDLQEPLRKIVVFGERLKEKCGEAFNDEGRDYLDRMQKAASRMQTLINDLLTFSRVTTKAQPFSRVNLAEICRDVVGDLEARIEQVNGRVEIGDLPTIDAEPLQIRQLMQNLIGNALKFRRTSENPVVRVQAELITGPRPRAEGEARPEKLCRLTVSDNGIGFDEKYLDRIFNVFQRLHGRNEFEGTGMGLAIARKIVLYHEGDITAKSRPGEGSAFVVTLPAERKETTHE